MFDEHKWKQLQTVISLPFFYRYISTAIIITVLYKEEEEEEEGGEKKKKRETIYRPLIPFQSAPQYRIQYTSTPSALFLGEWRFAPIPPWDGHLPTIEYYVINKFCSYNVMLGDVWTLATIGTTHLPLWIIVGYQHAFSSNY